MTEYELKDIHEDYVNSSVIKSYYWYAEFGNLIVEFQNGHSCEYTGVPHSVVFEWNYASSKGSYFNEKIKNNYRAYPG